MSIVEWMSDNPGSIYIFKPANGIEGRGIKLMKAKEIKVGSELLSTRGILQHYVHNPLLYNGVKTDIRVWIVMTSLKPMILFVSRRGYFRSAFQGPKYNSTSTNYLMHVTNYSPRARKKLFVKNVNAFESEQATLGTLRKYEWILLSQGLYPPEIWGRVKSVLTQAFLAMQRDLVTANQLHSQVSNMFVADLVVDENGSVYILEIMEKNGALKKSYHGDKVVLEEATMAQVNGVGLLSVQNLLHMLGNGCNLYRDRHACRLAIEDSVALQVAYDRLLPVP